MLIRVSARIVVVGLLGVVASGGCTRGNPAFGASDGADGTGTESSTVDTTRTTSDADTTGRPTASSDPDATVDPDTLTDANDDAQDPTTTTDPIDTDDDTATTDSSLCEVGKAPAFNVVMFDAANNEVPASCGDTFTISGPVLPADGDGIIVRSCVAGSTCDCEDYVEYTFVLPGLSPSPRDIIDDAINSCISLTFSRLSGADGCGVTWLSVETQTETANHPAFMAANVVEPDWGHLVPAPRLDEHLELCDGDVCEEHAPGYYSMYLGDDIGPIIPGEDGVAAMLDPYTNAPAPYRVHALFAQVAAECTIGLGWAAVEDL